MQTSPGRMGGKGSAVQLGGEQREPNPKPSDTQSALDPIAMFAPWAGEGEKALRARLYRSRDICGARAARSEGWIQHVFKTAEDLAGDWIWRRASEEELRRVANAVGRMIQAGTELEQGGLRDA